MAIKYRKVISKVICTNNGFNLVKYKQSIWIIGSNNPCLRYIILFINNVKIYVFSEKLINWFFIHLKHVVIFICSTFITSHSLLSYSKTLTASRNQLFLWQVLGWSEWLQLWDHILSNHPAFLLFVVVAFNITCRSSLLYVQNIEDFEVSSFKFDLLS